MIHSIFPISLLKPEKILLLNYLLVQRNHYIIYSIRELTFANSMISDICLFRNTAFMKLIKVILMKLKKNEAFTILDFS